MERYSEKVLLHARMLEREELDEFVDIVRSGFTDDHGFEIGAEHENLDLSVSSVGELAAHEKVPDRLERLTIRAWEPHKYSSVSQIQRAVRLSLSTLGPHISVDGLDETWVTGMAGRLQRFFDRKKPRWTKMRTLVKNRISLSMIGGLALVLNYQVAERLTFLASLLTAIATIYLFTVFVNWSIWAFAGAVTLRLRKRGRQILGMDPKDSVPILISLAVLLVSIAQLVVTIVR